MQRFNVRPSKPAAALSLVIGVAILVIGLTRSHHFTPFLIVWAIAVVGIVAFNLWAAFSPRGSAYSVTTSRDEPPR